MRPGEVIAARFQLQWLAGAGGMGSIWRSWDRHLDRPVALKLLHPQRQEDGRFEREAAILSRLRHPAIVEYVAHGRLPDGALYLAMEWLDGDDLGQRLGRGRLTPAETLALAVRAIDALTAIHRHGLVHRDVKPSNLFLQNSDVAQAKLVDFGIARPTSGETLTQTGHLVGTPAYAAPEQFKGADVGPAADVFALGCVVFECLTGRSPLGGGDPLLALARHATEEPPRPAEQVPEIPAELDDLVVRMITSDPSHRPRDGSEVQGFLARILLMDEPRSAHGSSVPMLTGGEQRIASLVFLAHVAAADVPASLVADHGGALYELADGCAVVFLAGLRAPSDQAIRAARCALALRNAAPQAALCVSTGGIGLFGRHPSGDDTALRLLSDLPLFVLALARDEVHESFPGLWLERRRQELRLAPLTRKAAESLLHDALPEISAQDSQQILEAAGGNPFFLEELVRARAGKPIATTPESVLAVLGARLEALPTEARRVLRAASVLGQRFTPPAVAALLGGVRAGADEWLRFLVSQDVLVRSPDGDEYRFVHALVRDAAYAMLTDVDRVLGHRLAGAWLEGRDAANPLILAEHFDRGQVPDHAVSWYHRAAVQELEANNLTGALRRAQRAIDLGAQGEDLAGLRLVQAQALISRGEFARAEACAHEVLELTSPGSTAWFQVLGELIVASGHQGDYDGTTKWAKRLLVEAPCPTAGNARLACASRAAGYLIDGGRYALAEQLLAMIDQDSSRESLDPVILAHIHFSESKRAQHQGLSSTFLACMQSAIACLEATGNARALCEAEVNIGAALIELGEVAGAETALNRSFRRADDLGVEQLRGVILINLGLVRFLQGSA